jgi:CHAT domain-containing protein
MEQRDLVQEFIRASEDGELDHKLAQDPVVIDLAIIESLKKEVDHYIRSDARQALKRAELAHRLSLQSTDPLARAVGQRAKAQALHVLGHYAEALELYEQTRQIYQHQNKEVEAARVSRAMIDALMYLGRYEEALSLAGEARQTFASHGERILTAQLETNVGNIHHRLDQYHEALACYNKASEVFAETGDLAAQGVIAFNSANIYSNLDDFRRAQSLYQQAYDLYHAQDLKMAATHVRYSLGYLHFLKGEYHQAMRVLHQVQIELMGFEDERMVGLCDLDLAEIYLQLNALHEAVEMAARARGRFQALALHYEAGKALMFQGLALMQRALLGEAEQALRKAQQEFTGEGNEIYLGLIDIYLADLMLKRNQPAEAIGLAADAEMLFSSHNLRAKTCYARLISVKALMLQGEIAHARELGELILEASQALEAPWLKYQIHEILGDALLETGDVQGAHEQYVQAVAFIERIRAGIRVDEYRSAFFKDKLSVYEKLIRLCLDRGDSDGQAEAFFYLENCKARTLVDMLVNELEVAPAGDDDSETERYRKWQQLLEELHWYYSKTTQHEAGGKSRQRTIDRKLWEEISTRERALADLARQAQIEDPHFVWLQHSDGLRAEELRNELAEDETVIEYYLDTDGLKIFVLSRRELQVVRTGHLRKELKALISELKFQFEKFQFDSSYLTTYQQTLLASVQGCLRELYEALFEPIAALVEGRKLIFIPFDLLHNVPFHALYDGEHYLLERHEIVYAPSARLHLMTARRHEREAGEMRALIFGVSDEGAPHITDEIDAIREMFPDARSITGENATARALAEYLPASDIVHIASHAVFRRDSPLFSAFKVAGGWMNFYDICSLRAKGALVVLSGCRTGVGSVYAGDEMFGLMRGFLYAGAAPLVASLWAVNDPATAELMASFYRSLHEGHRPAAALREAILHLKKRFEHPYYWAPFVLVGRNSRIPATKHRSFGSDRSSIDEH